MKANLLTWTFLLLLTVAIQLPAQQTEAERKLLADIRAKAEKGDAQSQNKLGAAFNDGSLGVVKDEVEAVKWYRKAANQGSADAQYNLAVCYFFGRGVVTNYTKTIELIRKSADQGFAQSEYILGVMYDNGDMLLPKDTAEAIKWYQKAAEQGIADAQYNLGLMYLSGKTVTQKDDGSLTMNLDVAEKWYLKAAEQGHISAQIQLGIIKLFFKKDYTDAQKWLRKAAEKDAAGAEYLLGTMYGKGWGMEKDYVEAAKWIQRSAEQGFEEAQIDIGVMYFKGEGLEKDFSEAYAWWNLAAKSSTNAASKRAFLEDRMTPEQIADAQKRTKELRVLVEARSKNEQSKIDPFSITQARKSAPTGTGTGFFITENGYLISNFHVIKGATKVRLLTGFGLVDATVLKVDTANDLALLKADGRFAPLPIAASRTVKLGATVATVGFPSTGLQGFSPKLTKGEIGSLAGASDDPRYFQISVPVQPGNSGGALVDAHGNVVGIVSAKLNAKAALDATGTLPENVNYAVKSSLLLSFLESVPDVAAKLKEPLTAERKFEDVVKSAQDAAVLVLVY